MLQTYIDFAFIKEQASFEAVLAHYNLNATRSGEQLAILCPFHRESRPSCKIRPDKKIFNCFACGAKGNVLEFTGRMEGAEDDLRSAAVKLAEICIDELAVKRLW